MANEAAGKIAEVLEHLPPQHSKETADANEYEPVPSYSITWIMYYREPGETFVKFKAFNFVDDRRQAYAKASQFCVKMNYRFIAIDSFLADLDKELESTYKEISFNYPK